MRFFSFISVVMTLLAAATANPGDFNTAVHPPFCTANNASTYYGSFHPSSADYSRLTNKATSCVPALQSIAQAQKNELLASLKEFFNNSVESECAKHKLKVMVDALLASPQRRDLPGAVNGIVGGELLVYALIILLI